MTLRLRTLLVAGALTSTTTSFLLRPTLTRHARMMERPTCFERSLILNNGFQRIRDCAATSHSRLSESREDQSNGSTEEKFTSENKKNSSSKADDLMTFDDAAIRLREVEDIERAKRSGSALTDEQKDKFTAKTGEMNSMRDRIRSRAQDLNIEKSVATKKAIEEATARAMAKEEAPTLDLSAFGASDDEDMSSSEDLTDDEREELDKYTKQGLLEQIKEEFSNVKWPTPGAALRLAGFMMIIFVLTAAYILKLDETVRYLYTEWGLIPKPDAEYDFSGLALPKGWENDMDSTADTVTGMMRQSVGDVADAIQQ